MKKLRVLWFAPTPSLYATNTISHNGGGWIEALERLVRTANDVDLGVAFEHSDNRFRVDRGGTAYYPISLGRKLRNRLLRNIWFDSEERYLMPHCLRIADDFAPDVIQVFGSEWCFGALAKYTSIPVVIHMQGSLPAYYNARLPPGFSRLDAIAGGTNGNISKILRNVHRDRVFRLRAEREEHILSSCKYFMGRTEWDRAIVSLYQPSAEYFHCDEALRSEFYVPHPLWHGPYLTGSLTIVSVISTPLYKGIDLILKCARLLKRLVHFEFQWKVFGVDECALQEAKIGVRAGELDVHLMGVVSANELKTALAQADLYVHPSYIDNSPNSICEAQMLGLPVIAANVGGVSSLIEHGATGLLVPANDPFLLAYSITVVSRDRCLQEKLSRTAHERAADRHSQPEILDTLLAIYRGLAARAERPRPSSADAAAGQSRPPHALA
jgi:glycosyltransferase involved in cell wall biosynthesis